MGHEKNQCGYREGEGRGMHARNSVLIMGRLKEIHKRQRQQRRQESKDGTQRNEEGGKISLPGKKNKEKSQLKECKEYRKATEGSG